MKILTIIEDEIIKSLFHKKYIPALSNIHQIEFGSYDLIYEEKIKKNQYNVVICDLDFDFAKVIQFYNKLKYNANFLFITDWEYTKYLQLLKESKISNIYPKGLIIEDYQTSIKLISNLNKGTIFGVHNYADSPSLLKTMLVHFSSEIRSISGQLNTFFPDLTKEQSIKLKLAFSEIATNAFFHSHGLEKGKEYYIKEPIYISFAEDSEKILFSVTDKKGTLTKETVFYWLLERFKDSEELPLDHGRGFFLMKNIIDNLIINIKENETTEFIAIFYKYDYMGEKSLVIHQI